MPHYSSGRLRMASKRMRSQERVMDGAQDESNIEIDGVQRRPLVPGVCNISDGIHRGGKNGSCGEDVSALSMAVDSP